MKIAILGQGIEAWTLAACLSSTGCSVEIEAERLPEETSEISEPDLLQLLRKQHPRYLSLSPEIHFQRQFDLILDARHVPEPDYQSRLHQVLTSELTADSEYAPTDSRPYQLIYVLVVPVPIGCTERLQHLAGQLSEGAAADISCVFWPNFLESGRAVESFTRAGRILIGGGSPRARQVLKNLLYPFNRSSDNLMWASSKEAEMTKIAINGMLATRISFMNELAALASREGVDIEAVRQGMGNDPRIGQNYLYPGCGFGGSSLEKALGYLVQAIDGQQIDGRQMDRQEQGQQTSLLASVLQKNQQQKDLLFQKFWRYYKADIQHKTVALWGGAFKPETSRVTGSTALVLLQALLSYKVRVRLYDPMAMHSLKRAVQQPPFSELQPEHYIEFCHSPQQAAQGCDAVFIVTEWKEFWNQNLEHIAQGMKHPLLIDGRNIYPPEHAFRAGMIYSGIGRGLHL